MRSLLLVLWTCAAVSGQDRVLVDRVGTTGFIQLEADSFQKLSPRQQTLAYWLTQASIAIDPIVYDQNSAWGLRQKRLLEGVVASVAGAHPQIVEFAKLFWANRGNHNEQTAAKFLPEFRFEELKTAAVEALRKGAFAKRAYGLPALSSEADLNRELEALRPSLFDANFEPSITAKSPQGKLDILQASANNFYSAVSLTDLKGFHEAYPLNSRLVKTREGKLVEEVYRAGTPDGKIPPGRYGPYLKKANEYLEKARAYAEPGQEPVIAALIRYYQTGDPADWLKFGAAWVGNNPPVDFANGFIEVYRDARAAKGTSQSFVSITDQKQNQLMTMLAANAQYFEDHAPWLPQYKKQGVKPPLAKAVETVVETGDFHANTVGDNLPNENEIREKNGTKSFLFTGSSRAILQASGFGSLEEFAASPAEIAIGKKYGVEASDLLTALHEIIGHGSGKLNPKYQGGTESLLKEYYSAMEEARADLMALWNITDPKLRELGLVSSPDVAKAMYYSAVRVGLTQLQRIPKGDTIEEDHQRNRQLIVNYLMDKTGAIQKIERNGKTYLLLKDFDKMHQGVGTLLAELMRIKAEGDYPALKALIDKYGVHFDPALRDQVVARYQKLNIPAYWCGINADLTAKLDSAGKVTGVALSDPRDYVRQQLGYAAMYAVQ
ncbi:MAG: dipeptidyl peptidase 3 [Acidobacteriia bacterium]|nr:dipeptidyl peptidase 3 [Terriglobia bacterium]